MGPNDNVQQLILMMNREPHRYYSCLIRIWEVHTNDERTWRASLERPGLDERVGFSNMEELFAFIREDVSRNNSDDADET